MGEKREIRFGEFLKAKRLTQTQVSYENLVIRPSKLRLSFLQIFKILKPYISVRFMEQFQLITPLAVYLILFQIFILSESVDDSTSVILGVFTAILGLMFFMEGLKKGLMPFCETIGYQLPAKQPLGIVLTIALLIGVGVTFAEPAIQALKTAGSQVRYEESPLLYLLLHQKQQGLVMSVGVGVGLACVLGMLRFVKNWGLKGPITLLLLPLLGLTAYGLLDQRFFDVVGLAWDSGAVTTGPVTVPLVLALGVGVSQSIGKNKSSLSGFGLVTLASLFPVLLVLLYGAYLLWSGSADGVGIHGVQEQIHAFSESPWAEISQGIRAIVPLFLFLLAIVYFFIREKIKEPKILVYGMILTILGMIVFLVGLKYGLTALGDQAGSKLPYAFLSVEGKEALYPQMLGFFVLFVFTALLGFGATLAEPALHALGITVENLSQGLFKRKTLIQLVAWGVGLGLVLGVFKIVFSWSLPWMICIGYAIALLLTWLVDEEYVNIAWDSAGVTTGPVTVPLVLSMGLGLGGALQVREGFGVLAMASICPIVLVLLMGLKIKFQKRMDQKK